MAKMKDKEEFLDFLYSTSRSFMKSYLVVIFTVALFSAPLARGQTFADYSFFELSPGTTSIQSSVNTLAAPTFNFPNSEPNQPTILRQGLGISQGKYISHTDEFDEDDSCCGFSLGMWMFHVNGLPGEFASLKFKIMNESQKKMVKLSGVMKNGVMKAKVTSGSFSSEFGEIKYGWNFVALGIDTNKLYWKICNGYT